MKKIFIIGAGLSGLLAAYWIKTLSDVEIVMIEQGTSFESRMNDPSSSLIKGVGGAGTLFGGKFCFPPASSAIWHKTTYTTSKFANFFSNCMAPFLPTDISNTYAARLYLQDKNITESFFSTQLILKNDMHAFVLKLKELVLKLGVIITEKTQFKSFTRLPDGKYALSYMDEFSTEHLAQTDWLIVASGRSSFNTIHEWFEKYSIVKRQPPDLGIRMTLDIKNHPMFVVGHDRKLKKEFGMVGVRTFCVCSGGETTLVQNEHLKYYDGHFTEQITDHINLGILARDNALAVDNIADSYCNALGKYVNSNMGLHDFIKLAPYIAKKETIIAPTLHAICKFLSCLINNGLLNTNPAEIPAYMPSVDRLNPQISTDNNFETILPNVYVVGDATGISRGFVQSLWSAYCASEHIASKLSNQAPISNANIAA